MKKLLMIGMVLALAACNMNTVTHPNSAQDCKDWGLKVGSNAFNHCVNKMSTVE